MSKRGFSTDPTTPAHVACGISTIRANQMIAALRARAGGARIAEKSISEIVEILMDVSEVMEMTPVEITFMSLMCGLKSRDKKDK